MFFKIRANKSEYVVHVNVVNEYIIYFTVEAFNVKQQKVF